MKIFLTLLFAIIATPALAAPAMIGSFIISTFMSAGWAAVLPAVSAAAVGTVVLRRLRK